MDFVSLMHYKKIFTKDNGVIKKPSMTFDYFFILNLPSCLFCYKVDKIAASRYNRDF